MTSIMIVDDHPLIRRGLRELIEQEQDLTVCAETPGTSEALRLHDEQRPDMMIVDISLQDGDGIELIKQLKALDPQLKMLVCSMHDERIYASRALRAGAMGYLNKSEPPEKLVEAIRRIVEGGLYVSAEMSDHLLHAVTGRGVEERARTGAERLSDREIEVLRMIGDGLTSREIAERLGLSIKTVDTHRENIKVKLKLRNANELIRYAVTWNLRPGATAS